jgi:hypothetical protein
MISSESLFNLVCCIRVLSSLFLTLLLSLAFSFSQSDLWKIHQIYNSFQRTNMRKLLAWEKCSLAWFRCKLSEFMDLYLIDYSNFYLLIPSKLSPSRQENRKVEQACFYYLAIKIFYNSIWINFDMLFGSVF